MEKKKSHKLLMFFTLIASLVYITWRIFFTLPLHEGIVSLIAGLALVIAESIGVIEAIEHYLNMTAGKTPEMPQIPGELLPDVDVLIATHNEDEKLLYKTINGCTHMLYPDKSKVHIYVCDDNNRPEIAALAQKLGVSYFGLSDNKFAKAGNLNNALRQTHSPLVATFDADMIPTSRFLLETVPYFFLPQYEKDKTGAWVRRSKDTGEKIGFIQTPQSFYNPDLFQYNLYSERSIPNEQDFFFRDINIGRNRTNSPIYAGSNTVISREALEDAGYIVQGNITEDFATGIEIQKKGYRCYAVDKPLAHGLAPVDVPGLLKQRERWGRGCVQTMRSSSLLFSKMPLGTKMSYVSSFLYWWTFMRRFVYIASPILFTVFGVQIVNCNLWELAIFWLPYYLLYNHSLKVMSGKIRTQRWSNIVDTIIFPYMIVPIFLESIGIRKRKFVVTNKNRNVDASSDFVYATPHILLTAASIVGLIFCVRDIIALDSFQNIVLIFWLVVNLYFLVMALLFMRGRINFRHEERLAAKVPVQIRIEGREEIRGETCDISESGMGVVLDFPEYIPYDTDVEIELKTDQYSATVPATVKHVTQSGSLWKYSMQINDEIDDADKQSYLQIVFDRQHTLPIVILSGWAEDLRVNLRSSKASRRASNRRLPRVVLARDVDTADGKRVQLSNFNYEFIRIDSPEAPADKLVLKLENGLEIPCSLQDADNRLYKIDNWKETAEDPRLHAQLAQWMGAPLPVPVRQAG
ncbi:MAG TPA: glycosyltransferase [Oscillospiraceae bacterium]|nr:glycosyltransferase [Oscillospiraceae bacterium]HRW56703.1 glycosyltransferase [Oscillospiraceae bacterium]